MAIHIRCHAKSQTVRSAFVFVGAISHAYIGDELQFQLSCNDLLANAIASNTYWYVDASPKSISEIFSFIEPHEPESNIMFSSIPGKVNNMPGSLYDDLTYGSIYDGLRLVNSVFFGGKTKIPSWKNESAIRHDTFSGELIAAQTALSLYPTTVYIGSNPVDTVWTQNVYRRQITVNSVDPLLVDFQWVNPTGGDISLLRFLDNCADRSFQELTYWNGAFVRRILSDVKYSYSDSQLVITYSMFLDFTYSYYQEYSWRGTITIPLRSGDRTVQPLVNRTYQPLNLEPLTFEYDVQVATRPYGLFHNSYVRFSDLDLRTYMTCMSEPKFTSTVEYSKMRSFAPQPPPLYNALNDFRHCVLDSWGDITPSAVFSTVDAFKQAEGFLGVNILQNLQKLPDISSMMPQISEAVKVLGHLVKRDLSLSTLRDILSLASSTNLQANFQWRPTLSVLIDYLPKMISTLHSLGDIERNAIGRGSYSFKIKDDLGRKEVTLKTRTKLVMDASPSGLLSAFLRFDALGLTPKPSNLWDLIPFSFAANWFTGIGPAIRRAEYSLMLVTIPAYYVHTYTLTSPLTDDELEKLETSSSSSVAPCLKLYYRDVSLHDPVPRDSRFGFGIPTEFPPMGILGSLLYQLIFG